MRSTEPISLLIDRLTRPLTLVDVGARWGAPNQWSLLGPKANVICFEPDEAECSRLRSTSAPNVSYLPLALGKAAGNMDIHVTMEPACSSVYKPRKSLYEKYNLKYIAPHRVVTVPCKTLDDALADAGIGVVDCIKLDTQGSELDILHGATRSIANCSFIDVEVEFNEIYEDQNLFCDVDRFLRTHGFVLWRFSELAHYADNRAPKAATQFHFSTDPFGSRYFSAPSGQIFWGQAHYVRAGFPATSDSALPLEQSIDAAVVVALYGYWDLAIEIIRKGGDLALADSLEKTLSTRAYFHQYPIVRYLAAKLSLLRRR